MAGELEGRVSIVTGGGSGMGRATSLLLAREGAAVAIADVNDEGGEATAAQIEDLGGESLFVHTDTSSEQDVVNAVAETAGRFGKLDSIVTAAGISYAKYLEGDDDTDPFLHPVEAGSSLHRPTEFWQKVIDVNLTGVMLCAREAARQMVAEGHGGTIVNFASTAAYSPSPIMTDYCVSKAGVVMLTRCFAVEFGPHGIRVNAVAPAPSRRPCWRGCTGLAAVLRPGAPCPLGARPSPRRWPSSSSSSPATAQATSPARRSASTAAPTRSRGETSPTGRPAGAMSRQT